jgi:hypothetical protein
MTTPNERYRSLKSAKKLLEELCDPGKTPRVPSAVRERAKDALRHFPRDWDIDSLAQECPNLFEKSGTKDKLLV